MTQCRASKADGSPCAAVPAPGRDLCMFHDPTLVRARHEGRRKGGAARSRPRATLPPDETAPAVKTAADVCSLLSDTINHVRTGQLDPRIANTVGYLAGVLVRALEVGKLEERLATLEAAVRGVRSPEPSPMEREFSNTAEYRL